MSRHLAWPLALLCSVCVFAKEEATPSKPAKEDPRFEKIKQLVGTWEQKVTVKEKSHTTKVHYKLTGGGSAVVETLFLGTPNEMVTIYHMDGPKLMMTHYCSLGNQPRMKAEKKMDGNKLEFTFDGITNVNPKNDSHMHNLKITFVGKEQLKHEWYMYANGKEASNAKFNFKKVKE